jgi:thiol-disulfide isomerase/thioredoxin
MLKFALLVFILFPSLVFGQSIESITLADLQKILQAPSDKILVVNFWATWCAPCIKELPLLERLNQENLSVDVLLVSMDYDLDPDLEKVVRFQSRKKLQSKILFLTETDPNAWIDKIDEKWSGALPTTLVLNAKKNKRELVQGELAEGQLEKIIKKLTN